MIGKQMVNLIGMIMAGALMFRYTFGLEEEADVIEQAIEQIIQSGATTRDIWKKEKRFCLLTQWEQRLQSRLSVIERYGCKKLIK